MSDTPIRWNIKISRETDIAVRTFLARTGFKKGDLSKFVEEAVRWRVLDQTLGDAHEKFRDLTDDELQALVDEAVADARAQRVRKRTSQRGG
jgi:Ribbon-helix-helix domain